MPDLLSRIKSVITEFVDVDPSEITLDSHLKDDLGADSLDLVEMVMFVEEEFDQ